VATDLYPSYPDVLQEFFGDNLIHQLCLLHLNKRIVNDFPKKTTFKQELTKYWLLNIFYNRDAEIEILKDKAEEEERVIKEKSGEEYKEWLKKEMKTFKKFLHEKKKERQRQKQNLKRPYFNSLQIFNTLIDEIDSFDKAIHKKITLKNKRN